MDLEEIVNRNTNIQIEQAESLFVIKEYVRIKKGIHINPVIFINVPQIFLVKQLKMMAAMSLHAIMWFKMNPNQIT